MREQIDYTDTLSLVRVGNRSPSGDFWYGLTRKCLQETDDGTYKKNKAAERKHALFKHFSPVESFPIEHVADVEPALRESLKLFNENSGQNKSLTLLYSPADQHQPGAIVERTRASFDIQRTQHLHTLDFDDLVAPEWLRGRAIQAHAHWLASDILPAPWCDTSFVAMFTGSHGAKHDKTDLYVPRMRLFFFTEPPLTPAGFRKHVLALEKQMQDAGVRHVGSLLDTTIYSPERMIFILPGMVTNGSGVAWAGERICYHDNDVDELSLEDRNENVVAIDDYRNGNAPNVTNKVEPGTYAGMDLDATFERMRTDSKTDLGMRRLRYLIAREYPDTNQRQQRRDAFTALLPRIVDTFKRINPDNEEVGRRLAETVGYDPASDYFHCRPAFADLERVAAKERERAGRFAIVPKVEIAPHIEEVGGNEPASIDIKQQIREHLEADMYRALNDVSELTDDSKRICAVFQHAAGVGKSQAALKAAIAKVFGAEQLYVIFAAPTKDLAKQLHKRARLAVFEHARDYHGMTARDAARYVQQTTQLALKTSRRENCIFEKPNVVDRENYGAAARNAEQFGLNPVELVCSACKQCDWADKCNSWHQPKKSVGQLSIVTHADLVTTFKRSRKRQPDVIIVDENFFGAIEASIDGTPTTDIANTKFLRAGSMYTEANHAELLTRIIDYRNQLRDALDKTDGQVLRGQVQHLGSIIQDALQAEDEYRKSKSKVIRQSIKRGVARHAAIKQHGPDIARSDTVRSIWQLMLRSLSVPGRKEIWELYTYTKNGTKKVGARWLDALPGRPSYILLDGSLKDTSEIDFVFGRKHDKIDFRFHDGKLPTPHVKAYQFVNKFYGKSSFTGQSTHGNSNAAQLSAFIRLQSYMHKRPLLICQNDVLANLKETLPANVSTLTFGSLRGKNEHRTADCLIMVGRPTLGPRDLERLARVRHHNNPRATEIKPHGRDWLDGRHDVQTITGPATIAAERHDDIRAETARRQMADDENQQGLARLRIADRDETTAPTVYYFGCSNLGVHVQGLYNSLPIITAREMAGAVGLLFEQPHVTHWFYTGKQVDAHGLSGQDKREYAEIWAQALKWENPYRESHYKGFSHLRAEHVQQKQFYRFRVTQSTSKRRRWYRVLDLFNRSGEEVRSLVERHLGRLTDWEAEQPTEKRQ